ncbi:hypothetical protein DSO57_1010415 [Entomophthora muscae]|uniref:Uncharacterized protein n=1 Tax=Entomophthora muscae TaxID=34485 RepID=A0ACC2S8A8_9FUNG|nr:hypothetical protein DSO57_1010415 [Entomophthora muscae]
MRVATFYLVVPRALCFNLGLYAGGCALSGGSLYYIGGALGVGESNLSPYTLSLNLSRGFQIDDHGNAPWETLKIKQGENFLPAKYPSVIPLEDSKKLVMYGGKGIKQSKSFQVFDPESKSWKINTSFEKSWNSTIGDAASENAFYQFTLTKNDNRVKNFIMYGGVSSTSNSKLFNHVARNLNSLGPSWSILPGGYKKVYGHVAAVFQEKLFIIGGVDAEDESLISMKHIPRFDVAAGLWNNAAAQGDIPESRTLHSAAQFNNIVYMTGGSASPESLEVISDDVYILDLNTLTWTRISVPGFQGSVSGCLAFYNGIIIHSFGYRYEPSSKTQIIDAFSWSLLNQSPPGEIKELQLSSSGAYIFLIIGSTLGAVAVVGIILGIVSCCFIRNKKHREKIVKEDELQPPELLQGLVWSTHKSITPHLISLSETSGPSFDDDVSNPSSYSKSMGTMLNSDTPF